MHKLRVPCGNATESNPGAPPWSASTTCETCGEYKPCRCSEERNLCRTLAYFAAWRRCCTCGAPVLYINDQARTDSTFICGRCCERREDLARKLARTSLPLRAAARLRSLFSAANDNAAVLP